MSVTTTHFALVMLLVPLTLTALCSMTASAGAEEGTAGEAAAVAEDERIALSLRLELDATGPTPQKAKRRSATAHLTIENRTDVAVRVYLPPSPFRASLSTISLSSDETTVVVPEPRPHGVVIDEDDFPLIAPGETLAAQETIPLTRFEAGQTLKVRWTLRNEIQTWEGGVQTLDGPTKELFGGGPIPHIWTGTLTAEGTWTVPDSDEASDQ